MRYFISKIIGDGQEFNPYRPKIADYGVSFSVDFRTENDWCIGVTSAADLTNVTNDPDIIVFPDLTFDTLIADVAAATVSAMRTDIESFTGKQFPALLPDTTFRRVLEVIGEEIGHTFNPERLTA